MRVIKKHYRRFDTTLVKINGEVFIHNSCKVFSYEDRNEICNIFNIPSAVKDSVELEILSLEEETDIESFFASNPIFYSIVKDINIQKRVAKSYNSYNLYNLSRNPYIQADIQHDLFDTGNIRVHEGLAYNKNVDVSVQLKLIKEGDICVICRLSNNISIHVDAQHEMFKLDDISLIRRLANNKNVHPDIQRKIMDSKDKKAINRLFRNLNIVKNIKQEIINSRIEG